jgi:antitoxin component YwqK of YwqJK toxin-antitoxin module
MLVLAISACKSRHNLSYRNNDSMSDSTGLKNNYQIDTIKSYYPTGVLKSVELKSQNKLNGLCIYYYDNGKIEGKFTYLNGRKDGFYQTLYQNWVLRSEGVMASDTVVTGDYYVYDRNGKLYEHLKFP